MDHLLNFMDGKVKFCKTPLRPHSWLTQNWVGIQFLPAQRFSQYDPMPPHILPFGQYLERKHF